VAGSFEALYASEWQAVWALLPVPAFFLVYWLGAGRRRAAGSGVPEAGFVAAYCGIFAVATLVDPISGGPVAHRLPDAAATALMFLFVWLGDFWVLALVFALARVPGALRRAVPWAFAVPALDLLLYFILLRSLWPGVPGQVLWLIHEFAFLSLALWLRAAWLPSRAEPEPTGHRRFLRRALGYAALYYALWVTADLLILAGFDAGWALRIVPNQLYYAFWVPFVFFSFFRRS
jgi:hypothetical protein